MCVCVCFFFHKNVLCKGILAKISVGNFVDFFNAFFALESCRSECQIHQGNHIFELRVRLI